MQKAEATEGSHDGPPPLCLLVYNILCKTHHVGVLERFVHTIPAAVDLVALQEVCEADLKHLKELCVAPSGADAKALPSPLPVFQLAQSHEQQKGFNVVLVNNARWAVRADGSGADQPCFGLLAEKRFDVGFACVQRKMPPPNAAAAGAIVCVASFHTPGGQTEAMSKTRRAQNVVVLTTILEHAAKVCSHVSPPGTPQPLVTVVAVGDGNFQQIGVGDMRGLRDDVAVALGLANDPKHALTVIPANAPTDGGGGRRAGDAPGEYGGFAVAVAVDGGSSHKHKYAVRLGLPAQWAWVDDPLSLGLSLVNSDHQAAMLHVGGAATAVGGGDPPAGHPAQPPAHPPAAHAPDQSAPSAPLPAAKPGAQAADDGHTKRAAIVTQMQALLGVESEKQLADAIGYHSTRGITVYLESGGGLFLEKCRETIEKDKKAVASPLLREALGLSVVAAASGAASGPPATAAAGGRVGFASPPKPAVGPAPLPPPSSPPHTAKPAAQAADDGHTKRAAIVTQMQALLGVESEKQLADAIGYHSTRGITVYLESGGGLFLEKCRETIEKDKKAVASPLLREALGMTNP